MTEKQLGCSLERWAGQMIQLMHIGNAETCDTFWCFVAHCTITWPVTLIIERCVWHRNGDQVCEIFSYSDQNKQLISVQNKCSKRCVQILQGWYSSKYTSQMLVKTLDLIFTLFLLWFLLYVYKSIGWTFFNSYIHQSIIPFINPEPLRSMTFIVP